MPLPCVRSDRAACHFACKRSDRPPSRACPVPQLRGANQSQPPSFNPRHASHAWPGKGPPARVASPRSTTDCPAVAPSGDADMKMGRASERPSARAFAPAFPHRLWRNASTLGNTAWPSASCGIACVLDDRRVSLLSQAECLCSSPPGAAIGHRKHTSWRR
jgi:hypothetical protein